jgi:hypothetical protein
MTRATSDLGGGLIAVVLFLTLAACDRAPEQDVEPDAPPPSPVTAEVQPGFLYGRIAVDGATYEGRLRWGGDQEAFWDDYFDGYKHQNPWAVHTPGESSPLEIFGFEIGGSNRSVRQFMARFGDIARVEAYFRRVRVTLKSGTAFELDRFSAGDIDDGVRVWDIRHGVVDLDTREIRTIEFLPAAPLAAVPERLHGTVRTRHGEFTGFIQWDREDGIGADELEGRAADGERTLRYDTIRSIARHSRDSALVTLLDGREMVLSGGETGRGNRGIYVADIRYGRVAISWDVFERVDFSPGGSGPGYGDFPPGRSLAGRVSTRDGRRLAGRLVYDFDESETTETFDVSDDGVDYNIPFGLITSIVPRGHDGEGARRATVTLHDGEQLHFERNGDLAERNAGMLIFANGRERPDYVPWSDVEQVDFDRAPAVYPSRGGP